MARGSTCRRIPCGHEVVAKSVELDDVNGIDNKHLICRSGYLHIRCLPSMPLTLSGYADFETTECPHGIRCRQVEPRVITIARRPPIVTLTYLKGGGRVPYIRA